MRMCRGRPIKHFMTPTIIILDRGPDPQTPRSRHFSTARNQSNCFGAPARAYPPVPGTLPTHSWVQFSPKFEFWATSKFFQPHARPPDPTLAGVWICSTGRPLLSLSLEEDYFNGSFKFLRVWVGTHSARGASAFLSANQGFKGRVICWE